MSQSSSSRSTDAGVSSQSDSNQKPTSPEPSRRNALVATAAIAAAASLAGPLPGKASAAPSYRSPPLTGMVNPVRDAVRGIALKYNLRETEKEIFNELWKLKKRSDEFEKDNHAAVSDEVSVAYDTFRDVVNGTPSQKTGHKHVKRAPVAGKKYVIFSDHHLAHRGHRQNFFASSGNRNMYRQLLTQYNNKNYTLVENGDVEELIIFEPTLSEAQSRVAMTWGELRAHRTTKRTEQLQRIIQDSQGLYNQIAQTFHADGRYVRIVGNHDQDLQLPQLLDVLRQTYPGIQPYDYLFLEKDVFNRNPQKNVSAKNSGKKPTRSQLGRADVSKKTEFVVAHGHQFDKATAPRFAAKYGEVISESLAWAFQGGDRTWSWNDQVSRWATGRSMFRNSLVTDQYVWKQNAFNTVWAGIGAAAGTLNDPNGWEYLFKHNIAWEYFEEPTPRKAIRNEVKTGDEFFKLRHLNELTIADKLTAMFGPKKRPHLILGHTHEPRLTPSRLAGRGMPATTFEHYSNSGAAGRYENLIWGIEIDNGSVRMISWSKNSQGQPERRVHENVDTGVGGMALRASASADALP